MTAVIVAREIAFEEKIEFLQTAIQRLGATAARSFCNRSAFGAASVQVTALN